MDSVGISEILEENKGGNLKDPKTVQERKAELSDFLGKTVAQPGNNNNLVSVAVVEHDVCGLLRGIQYDPRLMEITFDSEAMSDPLNNILVQGHTWEKNKPGKIMAVSTDRSGEVLVLAFIPTAEVTEKYGADVVSSISTPVEIEVAQPAD